MDDNVYVRPTWDNYWLGIMEMVSKRATCNRGRSGCVIVRNNQLLVTGYVGSPPGFPHCDDVGHLFKKVVDGETQAVSEHCVRTIHAEMNAILQAARDGISVNGAIIYCRMTPCRSCAMAIIRAGIVRVVAQRFYKNAVESIEIFNDAGVQLEHIHTGVQKY